MKKLIFALTLIVAFTACKKDPPPPDNPPCMDGDLPCLTTEGKNMFACHVNGQPWIAEAPFSITGPAALNGEFNWQEGWLYIKAVRKINEQNIYESLKVYGRGIDGCMNDSIRSLNPTPSGFVNYYQSNCSEYYHDTLKKGVLNITHLDTANYVISGTFSMKLFNSSCQDSIMNVTNGRFDFKYAY